MGNADLHGERVSMIIAIGVAAGAVVLAFAFVLGLRAWARKCTRVHDRPLTRRQWHDEQCFCTDEADLGWGMNEHRQCAFCFANGCCAG